MRNAQRLVLLGGSSIAIILAMVASFFLFQTRGAHAVASTAASQGTRQIYSVGTSSFTASSSGTNDPAWPEFAGAANNEQGAAPYNGSIFNRSDSQSTGHGASANSSKKAKSNPELNLSFDGL